jgi:hypothetical protein
METIQKSITDERTQKICGASIQHDISQKKRGTGTCSTGMNLEKSVTIVPRPHIV